MLAQARARPVLPLREGHVSQRPRLNIRLSSKDLEAIQKRALAEI
jgi:predicted DNA binding CopG/RHH family protein